MSYAHSVHLIKLSQAITKHGMQSSLTGGLRPGGSFAVAEPPEGASAITTGIAAAGAGGLLNPFKRSRGLWSNKGALVAGLAVGGGQALYNNWIKDNNRYLM
jgi:hypothetical protein